MKNAAPKAITVNNAIDDVLRRDRGRLLAGLIARLGDFQIAEDALQDAIISALGHWGRSGIPNSPTAWLMKVAHNKGIDRHRNRSREEQKARDFAQTLPPSGHIDDPEDIPDERLRLIFACCHPALEEKSRVALTLRTVCGLTTGEIANAFLDQEPSMGQRISRAKAKIKAKGIAFRLPEPEQWGTRLEIVLSTIYLIFTTGYVAGEVCARDLCKEALFLNRLLLKLRPEDSEIEGALALMLLTECRTKARVGADGATLPIEKQDQTLWDQHQFAEALGLLETAIARKQPGAFQIKAAIADCHMLPSVPDWRQMSLLYQSLWRHEPTPVIALNWAVVLAELGKTELALDKLDLLRAELSTFQPWHAARANILCKMQRQRDAISAYDTAIRLAPNSANRIFLEKRRTSIQQSMQNNVAKQ